MEIGQPEDICQSTNIVSCFTHQIDDLLWSALKLIGSGPPVLDSFLGPKWLFKLSFDHPREKERKKENDCKERNKLSAFTRLLLTGDICY